MAKRTASPSPTPIRHEDYLDEPSQPLSRRDSARSGIASCLNPKEISLVASQMAHSSEEFIRHVWLRGWHVVSHASLPLWMHDNEFLQYGHRPELNSFHQCFKSIFRVHTETGNIWTHLIGSVCFIAVLITHLAQPRIFVQWQEKLVISFFYIGAVLCMGLSCIFHTVYCHSETVGKWFNKLDYAGIGFLTMGSFVPYIYYAFYCRFWEKVIYMLSIIVLGILATIVSMADKFAKPKYRAFRAAVFIALGLSGVIPATHMVVINGWHYDGNHNSMAYLVLMAFCYIFGAVIYALRVPERIFPGRFDIWLHSHQIFHIFVVIASWLHFEGVLKLTDFRLNEKDCSTQFNFDTVNATIVDGMRVSRFYSW